jgi:hypothetical protein
MVDGQAASEQQAAKLNQRFGERGSTDALSLETQARMSSTPRGRTTPGSTPDSALYEQNVSFIQRALINNLSARPGAIVYYLRKQGMQAVIRKDGRVAVRESKNEPWAFVDPPGTNGWADFIQDITTDVADEILAGMATAKMGAIGAGVGLATGGPALGIAGGASGLALGGVGTELVRQALGELFGLKGNIDLPQVGMVGGLSAAIPVAGRLMATPVRKLMRWVGNKLFESKRPTKSVLAALMELRDNGPNQQAEDILTFRMSNADDIPTYSSIATDLAWKISKKNMDELIPEAATARGIISNSKATVSMTDEVLDMMKGSFSHVLEDGEQAAMRRVAAGIVRRALRMRGVDPKVIKPIVARLKTEEGAASFISGGGRSVRAQIPGVDRRIFPTDAFKEINIAGALDDMPVRHAEVIKRFVDNSANWGINTQAGLVTSSNLDAAAKGFRGSIRRSMGEAIDAEQLAANPSIGGDALFSNIRAVESQKKAARENLWYLLGGKNLRTEAEGRIKNIATGQTSEGKRTVVREFDETFGVGTSPAKSGVHDMDQTMRPWRNYTQGNRAFDPLVPEERLSTLERMDRAAIGSQTAFSEPGGQPSSRLFVTMTGRPRGAEMGRFITTAGGASTLLGGGVGAAAAGGPMGAVIGGGLPLLGTIGGLIAFSSPKRALATTKAIGAAGNKLVNFLARRGEPPDFLQSPLLTRAFTPSFYPMIQSVIRATASDSTEPRMTQEERDNLDAFLQQNASSLTGR